MFFENNTQRNPTGYSEDNEAYVEDLLWEFSSSLAEALVSSLARLGFSPQWGSLEVCRARAEASIATFITQNQEIELELIDASYSLHNVARSVLQDLVSVGVWACKPTLSPEQIRWLTNRCLSDLLQQA